MKSRVKSRVLVRERRLGCRLGDTVELAATQYERTLEESPPWDAPPPGPPPRGPPPWEPRAPYPTAAHDGFKRPPESAWERLARPWLCGSKAHGDPPNRRVGAHRTPFSGRVFCGRGLGTRAPPSPPVSGSPFVRAGVGGGERAALGALWGEVAALLEGGPRGRDVCVQPLELPRVTLAEHWPVARSRSVAAEAEPLGGELEPLGAEGRGEYGEPCCERVEVLGGDARRVEERRDEERRARVGGGHLGLAELPAE